MMRTIKYIPKATSARTEYREIDAEDQQWLQVELIRWLSLIGELDQTHDEDLRLFRDSWWHRKSKDLSKGQFGPNSPCSIIAGIVNNMMFKDKPQRDFTEKQMRDIEYISMTLSGIFPQGATAVRFQIGFSQ
jgi:hypothetical protein